MDISRGSSNLRGQTPPDNICQPDFSFPTISFSSQPGCTCWVDRCLHCRKFSMWNHRCIYDEKGKKRGEKRHEGSSNFEFNTSRWIWRFESSRNVNRARAKGNHERAKRSGRITWFMYKIASWTTHRLSAITPLNCSQLSKSSSCNPRRCGGAQKWFCWKMWW